MSVATRLASRVVEALGSTADSVHLHINGSSVAVLAGQQMATPDTTVAKRIRRVRGISTVVKPRPAQ